MMGRYCSILGEGLWSDEGLCSPRGLQERPAWREWEAAAAAACW